MNTDTVRVGPTPNRRPPRPARFAPGRAGAVADLGGSVPQAPADAYPAVQSAVDAARGATRVLLPAGDFWFSHPLWVDRDNVEVRGAGETQTRFHFSGGPGLIVGIRRAKANVGLTDDHFPPTALDATAAGRVGFRTRGDAVLQLPNHRMCWGGPVAGSNAYDCWADMKALTVEVALDLNGAANIPVLAMGNSWADPQPFRLYAVAYAGRPDLAALGLQYRLAGDAMTQGGGYRNAWMAVPARGPFRAAFVLDFADTKSLTGRLEGKPAAVGGQTALPAGLARTRGQWPAAFFHDGPASAAGNVADTTLYGCCLAATDPAPTQAATHRPRGERATARP